MTITINSCTVEISTRHCYVRMPWIGEAFIDFEHPLKWSCCDPWSRVRTD